MCYISLLSLPNFTLKKSTGVFFFFLVSIFCSSEAFSSPQKHTETILFSSVGYTNKSGTLEAQKKRAVLAGKLLAERHLKSFFKMLLPQEPLSQALKDWKNNLIIYENRIISSEDPRYNDNLFGVILYGSFEQEIPRASSSSPINTSDSALAIDFNSNKSTYFEGEEIILDFVGNRDFYASILDINDKQELIQLLPNAFRTENSFTLGNKYYFPDLAAGDEFRLEVSPPFGKERVHIIASTTPFETVLQIDEDAVFPVVKKDFQAIITPLHHKILEREFSELSSTLYQYIQFSTKVITLTTQAGSDNN